MNNLIDCSDYKTNRDFALFLYDFKCENNSAIIFRNAKIEHKRMVKWWISNELKINVLPLFKSEGEECIDVMYDLTNKSDWSKFFKSIKIPNIDYTETVYPSKKLMFRAFKLTPLKKIKVVLIGQDPYFNGEADGLCFSISKGTKIPSSLNNIFKELRNCGYTTNTTELSGWAKQGVFMINTALTVRKGEAGSQIDKWEDFTKSLFKYISKECHDLVIIMLGLKAQAFKKHFKNKTFSFQCTSHPSGFSCNKGFLGSEIFKKVNEDLKSKNIKEIDWNL